jgi:hypothetical protein
VNILIKTSWSSACHSSIVCLPQKVKATWQVFFSLPVASKNRIE